MGVAQHRGAWLIGLAALLFGALAPGAASAQHITTDGSLGAKLTLSGPNYAIPATLGQQVGGNLFHSFGIFGLSTGETATFSDTARPNTVNNVIGRVTGGSPSSIDGAINTDPATLKGANLYLINPFGMVFGPHATVNVSGSFHASTADYIRTSDGAKFQATTASGSTLSAAAPAAFGFLNAKPPAITVNGSQLGVTAPGATLGVVGGPVTVENSARLSAPAGKIHIAAVAGPGEIPVDPTNATGVTVTEFAPVSITGGSLLSVSDPTNHGSGGGIFIRAGSLTISASTLDGDNYGTGSGGELALDASGLVDLNNNAYVHAIAQSSGAGAPIAIGAGALTVETSAAIGSGTNASGSGGPLNLTLSGGLTVSSGGRVVSDTEGTGSGGAITVLAGSMAIDGTGAPKDVQTGVISQSGGPSAAAPISVTISGTLSINGDPAATSCFDCTIIGSQPLSIGAKGDIAVSAQQISLTNGGAIASDTFSGNAGAVSVDATQTITLAGGPIGSHISADADGGAAGNVVVDAGGNVTVSGRSYISADTLASGAAGNVEVGAGGDLTLLSASYISADSYSGVNAGSVTVSAGGDLTLAQASHLSVDAFSTGNAGQIIVNVGGDLSLSGVTKPGTSNISAQSFGGGMGGSVGVTVGGALALSDASTIAADTNAGGPAGTVKVSVSGDLTLSDVTKSGGSSIAADTFSGGTAGSVSVAVGGYLMQSDGSFISAAALSTKGGTAGRGGTVQVSAHGDATLLGGSYVSADSYFSGNAGLVTFVAQNLTLGGRLAGIPSYISADSFEGGTAGTVTVTANGNLALTGGTYISADALRNTGNGGTVQATIRGDAALSNGSHFSAESFGGGNAGTVSIGVSGNLSLLTTAFISGDSLVGGGNAGKVTVAVSGNLLLSDTSQPGGSYIAADALFSRAARTPCPTPATCPTGNAGSVMVSVGGDTTLLDGSFISTDAFVGGLGGSVTLAAHNLTLDQGAYISADSLHSAGQAGDVTVMLGGDLSLTNSASITTQSNGAGNAGNVVVTVAGTAVVNLSNISSDTLGGVGNGGRVIITAGALTIASDGFVSSSTSGAGDGGDIVVIAPKFTLADGGVIFANTLGSGKGGNVTVQSMSNGSGMLAIDGALMTGTLPPTGILARAQPGSSGPAGTITIQADALTIVNGGVITTNTQGSGAAGQVVVDAGAVSLASGGTISSDTLGAGSGNAGEVVVDATGAVSLDGAATAISSKSTTDANGSQSNGNAGTVTVAAGTLSVINGGTISSSTGGRGAGGDVALTIADGVTLAGGGVPQISAGSSGTGDAGSIAITAANLRMNDHAAISTQSATANGGNITLRVGDLMFLTDSKITTSVAKGLGNGGNITIDPIDLVLLRSEIIAQAQQGNGGNITILADEFLQSPDSVVSASSQLGISGTIDIVGPRTDLNGSLVVLSGELRSAAEVLRNRCAARSALPRSSLTEAGRGGLPQDPETTIPALYLAGRDADLSAPSAAPALPASATRQSRLRLTMHCGA